MYYLHYVKYLLHNKGDKKAQLVVDSQIDLIPVPPLMGNRHKRSGFGQILSGMTVKMRLRIPLTPPLIKISTNSKGSYCNFKKYAYLAAALPHSRVRE